MTEESEGRRRKVRARESARERRLRGGGGWGSAALFFAVGETTRIRSLFPVSDSEAYLAPRIASRGEPLVPRLQLTRRQETEQPRRR